MGLFWKYFYFVYWVRGDWYSGFVIEFDIEFDDEWVKNRKDESCVFYEWDEDVDIDEFEEFVEELIVISIV